MWELRRRRSLGWILLCQVICTVEPLPFLKIDTQGYEWQVLDGARESLSQCQGVLCELSLVPLYEGQCLWMEMIQRLESGGFTLWSIQKGFTDLRDGRTLQVDAIFLRI